MLRAPEFHSVHATLIINPSSGDEEPNSEKVPLIRQLLASAPFELNVVETTPDISAARLAHEALEQGCQTIIVGGGDGTIGKVAAELVNRPATLGILPIGTFNNIARSVGIPPDLEAACAVILNGHSRRIDVGQTEDGRYFFEAAGAGLDAALFPLGEEIKGGRWTRIFQALRLALQYKRQNFEITLSGPGPERRIFRRALLVIAANGPYYGGGFTVAPGARLRDGLLTLSIYRNFSKWELVRHFRSISMGRRHYSPKIETYTAAEIYLSALHPVQVHVDGQPAGHTPVTLRTVPAALCVFAPEADHSTPT